MSMPIADMFFFPNILIFHVTYSLLVIIHDMDEFVYTILIFILQTFRSWAATSHIRPPMGFLSHNSSDTPGLAPLMNVLFWGRYDFPISISGRDV